MTRVNVLACERASLWFCAWPGDRDPLDRRLTFTWAGVISVHPSPIVYRGEPKTIEHLAPFLFPCSCKGIEVVIAARFTNHCYTTAFDPEQHTKDEILLYEAADRARVFCPVRHALSSRLPEIVRELPKNKVHQAASRRNFVFMAPVEVDGESYSVFFMLQRAREGTAKLRLTVESAYLTDGKVLLPKLPGKIRFDVLAYKTLKGEVIKFAPR